MNKIYRYLGIVLSLLLIISCQTKVNSQLIVNDDKCVFPCWNNIAPGKTPYLQAKEILLNTSSVDKESIEESTTPWNGFDCLFWTMNEDVAGRIYAMNGIVQLISFHSEPGDTIFNKHKVLKIKNSEAIQKFGNPESIIITRQYNGFVFLGVYVEKGVYFSYEARRNLFNSVDTFPESGFISEIAYFEPNIFPTLLEAGWFSTDKRTVKDFQAYSYSWNGYGTLDEKYPLK